MSRTRGWCFTVNNYTDDDMGHVMSLYEENTDVSYLIVGFEEGSRCKTKHMQGYIYYNNPQRFARMRDRFRMDGKQHHIEAQKAKFNVNAYAYCMKGLDDVYEIGERPRQGNRTDLEVIKYDIHNGRPMKEIAKDYFSQWCQYRRSFDEYKRMIAPEYETKVFYYDHTSPLSQFRRIREEYRNYKIVTDIISSMELMRIVSSGEYEYIFVPNLAMYEEYAEDFDGSIY